MTYRTFDPERTMKDLCIAWQLYPDERPLDVLRELKRGRGDGWRVPSEKEDNSEGQK
jgi:hypothetical protein